MPELPEVETVVRGLRTRIIGWQLSRVEVCQEKCVRGCRGSLADLLRKKKILAVERRGKNIILRLSGGGRRVRSPGDERETARPAPECSP